MQYLVAIHHRADYDPATEEDEAMAHDIDAVNDAMVAAGIRIFVGGLASVRAARSVVLGADGDCTVTDGPYLESKEYVGGFWVLELPDIEEATKWGRRAAKACRAPVEVRPFN